MFQRKKRKKYKEYYKLENIQTGEIVEGFIHELPEKTGLKTTGLLLFKNYETIKNWKKLSTGK